MCLFFQESVLKGHMPVVGSVEVRLKMFLLYTNELPMNEQEN